MKQKPCPKCQTLISPDYVGVYEHNPYLCLQAQLDASKAEIQRLKTTVDQWRDGWFQMREACGSNYWNGYEDGKKVGQC